MNEIIIMKLPDAEKYISKIYEVYEIKDPKDED
jgi:hypothetical protein